MTKPKIGEMQPPQLTNSAGGAHAGNFGSTLGTSGIAKITPVGNIGALRDKTASTKMEEPRSLPVGEVEALRHDEKSSKLSALKIVPKYKTDAGASMEATPAATDSKDKHLRQFSQNI